MIRWLRNVVSAMMILYLVYLALTMDEDSLVNLLAGGDDSTEIGYSDHGSHHSHKIHVPHSTEEDPINIICVSCSKANYNGQREIDKPLSQALTSIKTAVLFSKRKVHIHVFTEELMQGLFNEELSMVKSRHKNLNFDFTIRIIDYGLLPESLRKAWKVWYKPCGSFRLLTPFILPELGIHQAIYADSDVIWTRPVDLLWDQLKNFKGKQVMAVAPTAPLEDKLPGGRIQSIKEHYDTNEKYILDTEDRGMYQINTGVLLMDFTKMIGSKWTGPHSGSPREDINGYSTELLLAYYSKYKSEAEHDQKLMNYVFHYNNELLMPLPCEFNWKTDYCMQEKKHLDCKAANTHGPVGIHGTTSAFYSNDHPVLKMFFRVVKEYDWSSDESDIMKEKIGEEFEEALQQSRFENTYCGKKIQSAISALKISSEEAKAKRLS